VTECPRGLSGAGRLPPGRWRSCCSGFPGGECAHAADRTSVVAYGAHIRAQAVSYGANGAVRVCDVYPDGYGVAVRYHRRFGDRQTLTNSRGNSNCTETTDIKSNPIVLFAACVVIDGIDYCNTQYADTGR
jgi:hypothetical protein